MTLSIYTLGLLISLAIFPLAVAISVGCACLFLKLLHLTVGREFKDEGPYASLETARWLLLNLAVNGMNIVPLLNGEEYFGPNRPYSPTLLQMKLGACSCPNTAHALLLSDCCLNPFLSS